MRCIYTTLLIFCTLTGLAQSSWQQKTDSVAKLVQQYYNAKEVATLYGLTGEKFHKELTEAVFGQTVHAIHAQYGELTGLSFESAAAKVAKYKASFGNAIMSMYFGLDDKDKLQTFLLSPYEPEAKKKNGNVPFQNPLRTDLDKKVDSLVSPFMQKENTIGLVAGVLENGQMHIYGYGETVKGNKQVPDGNTLFEIGSISKTFTATLLAYLVGQKKLGLNDPVNKYLPDSVGPLQFNGQGIPLVTLSNHTSGLPRMPSNIIQADENKDNPYKNYDDPKLFSFLKNLPLQQEPGKRYDYSNLGVGLLAVILERVSGKSYEQLLSTNICGPLGMKDTKLRLHQQDSARFAQGYNNNGEPVHSWEFHSLAGAGGIRSTMHDMLLYARAQVETGNSTLQKAITATHQQTFEAGDTKVALGWHINNYEGITYVAHSGQTGGYISSMVVDPVSKKAVVLLMNATVQPGIMAHILLSWVVKNKKG